MQTRNTMAPGIGFMRMAMAAGVVLLAISALSMFGPTDAAAVDDHPAWTLDCVDLAEAHLEYLLLDEVMAGRGPAIYADIDLAAAQLEYLLLPEVRLAGSCRGSFAGA